MKIRTKHMQEVGIQQALKEGVKKKMSEAKARSKTQLNKKNGELEERFEQVETDYNNDASDIEEDNEAQFI